MDGMKGPHARSRLGTRERVGFARFACLNCDGEVHTDKAAATEQIYEGLRWVGVPCSGCDRTYTVEMVDEEKAEERGDFIKGIGIDVDLLT